MIRKIFTNKSTIVLFIAYIVPVFLLISLSFFSVVTFQNYHDIYENLYEKSQDIMEKEHDIIAQPLWNVNVERTKQIMISIMTDPDVSGIAIYDENKELFCNNGNLEGLSYDQVKDLFSYQSQHFSYYDAIRHFIKVVFGSYTEDHINYVNGEKKIHFQTDAGTEYAGTFFILLTFENRDRWFHSRLREDFLWMSLLLLSVIVGVVIVYWRTTLTPLHVLLGGIHAAREKRFVEIVGYNGASEIDIVIQTFNELQKKQLEHQQYLEGEKDRLEISVSQRTKALNESQEKYKNLVESTNDWIWQVDRHGLLVYSNSQSYEITGYSPTEILGKAFLDLVVPEDREYLQDIFTHHRVFTEPVVKTNRHKNGNFIISETSMVAIFDGDGNFQGYRGIDRNINERRKLEKVLKNQHDLGVALGLAATLRDALGICLEAVLRSSHFDSGGFYFVNQNKGDISLVTHKNLPESFLRTAAHFDADSPQAKLIMKGVPIYESYTALIQGMELTEKQKTDRLDSGFQSIAIIPILHEGKVIAVMNVGSSIIAEITQFDKHALETIVSQVSGRLAKIEVDQALEESRINFSALFNSLDDFLFVLDSSGNIVEYNTLVKNRLGFTETELKQLNVLDLHPAARRTEAAEIVQQMLEGKAASCLIPLQTQKGELIQVETKITIGTWNNKKAVFGVSRDVTSLKRSQEQIQKNLKEKEVLLQEVNHRVKNNLTSIISILYNEKDRAQEEGMIEYLPRLQETVDRVEALLCVHTMLSRGGWKPLLLSQLCEEILLKVVQGSAIANSVAYDVTSSDVFINSDQAHYLTLVLSELATNTIKYSIKTGDKINIHVSLHRQNDLIILAFCDDGAGFSEFVLSGNFPETCVGFKLIIGLVRQSLQGKIEIMNDNGALVQITFPSMSPESNNEASSHE